MDCLSIKLVESLSTILKYTSYDDSERCKLYRLSSNREKNSSIEAKEARIVKPTIHRPSLPLLYTECMVRQQGPSESR
jgi:hypothetical protein